MNKLFYILLITGLLAQQASGQLVATTNANASQLAQILAGNGVVISNVTMNCPNGAAGTFMNNGSNLGMQQGIVLTTGSDTMVAGPNASGSQGLDNLAPGDAQLNSLAGATTHDACALEFDMNVLGDSVEFKYVFGSEEYLEWVSSGYNDAFAFFISGPGIVGQQNIALVPGTSTPVTIDNVNNGTNSQYYVMNGDGYTAPFNASTSYIQYDGFTTVLTAKKKGLQPCQTYHLKLVIADAGDGIYDSGVFLEANSLTSNFVSIDTAETNVPNVQNAMEGCVQGVVRFRLNHPVATPTTVQYTISGTAVNGVDYTTIGNTITIPAGDTLASLFINPMSDNIAEGTENVIIRLYTACTNMPYDSAVVLIIDSFGINAGPDVNICAGDQVQLAATGLGVVSWTPASTLSAANILNPFASPTTTTTYHIVADLGICQSSDDVTVNISSPSFSVNAGPDISNCSGSGIQLNATVSGSPMNGQPFVYSWTPANSLSASNIANPTASPAANTTYTVQVASGNCKVTDTIQVMLGSLNITATGTNETCYGYHDGTATAVANGTAPYTYLWSNNAATQTISQLNGGNYQVTVTDNNGCSSTAAVTISSTSPFLFSNIAVTDVKCYGGNDGNISVTATGGNGNISYVWNTGGTGNTAAALTANTPYTVSATDADGCMADTSFTLAAPAPVTVTIAATDITCNPGGAGTSITPNAGHDGTVSATANGGTGTISYLWNTPNADATAAVSNLTAGNYSVVVTDANHCSASANATLSEPQPMSITASSLAPLCINNANGTITANSTGGTGTYDFALSFNNTVIQTNGTGGFTGLVAGDYVISVSDARNCVKTANINLPQPPADAFDISTTPTSCFGPEFTDGKIIITPVSTLNQPYLYALDGGSNQQLNEFNGVSAGSHRLMMTNSRGCITDTTVTVEQPAQVTVEIIPDNSSVQTGESVQLNTVLSNSNFTDVSYNWSPDQGLSCVDCASPVVSSYDNNNEYSLTVTYNGHCKATATASIRVSGNPAPFVPNVFTPNGDGNNDVFMVFGKNLGKVNLMVFNRWGEKVFESNNQYAGWDGTYKGEMQNTNVFVYQVTATYLDGSTYATNGTVTLVR